MTDLTKAAQAVVSAWKAGELGLGIKEFSALEAALAAQQAAQPVAEVHAAHLRPAEDGGHWCREVLLYSGGNPGDQFANANRVKLYAAAQPQQAAPGPVLTDAEIHTLAMDVELAQSDGHIERAYARAIEAAVLAKVQPVAFGDEVIDYINRYGGHCRDCADENGVCPSRGLPCADSKKAIRFVLEALAYGLNNGYLKPAPAQPQQAASCTDPHCPCRDGDTCHYKDGPDGTKAWAAQPDAQPQQAAPP